MKKLMRDLGLVLLGLLAARCFVLTLENAELKKQLCKASKLEDYQGYPLSITELPKGNWRTVKEDDCEFFGFVQNMDDDSPSNPVVAVYSFREIPYRFDPEELRKEYDSRAEMKVRSFTTETGEQCFEFTGKESSI